jgi:hypothetical protein
MKEKRTKVAIVGAVNHRILAPYDDPEFEIWGINDMFQYGDIKRWDRWFQIHDLNYYQTRPGGITIEETLQLYAKWGCPVYMYEKYPAVPNSIRFPYEKLIDEFGRYFNNTISWLIAFAIMEGFKEIHVYGVDMAVNSEYAIQRPSCEYFLGIATGRGIKVHVPEESELLKTKFLYGYEQQEEDAYKKELQMKIEHATKQLQAAARQEEEAKITKYRYEGVITTIHELLAHL